MLLNGKHALVTGSSRGIGRGIALKLAEQGVKTAIHYYTQEDAANETLAKVRACGAEGFIVQADVTRPEEIQRMFDRIQREFGTLDILVSNARPELAAFYQPPLDLTLEQWRSAVDSQAQAFLLETQMAARLMPDGARIIAISYSPSGRTGSWQPWAAMGAAKAALDALARYFAVALGPRGITVNVISPGATEDSVVGRLPTEVFQGYQNLARERLDTAGPGGHSGRYWQCCTLAVHGRSELYHRANAPRGWWGVHHGPGVPTGDSARLNGTPASVTLLPTGIEF